MALDEGARPLNASRVSRLTRRAWISGAAAAAVAVPAGAWWLRGRDPQPAPGPRGDLRRDPRGVFDLLEGFSYAVIDRAGRRMDDGFMVPRRPDGMACFAGPGGEVVLMRNHEMPQGLSVTSLMGRSWPREAYDRNGAGAVTRLVLDPETLSPRSSNLVLAGTSMNCSGGPSPAGWLSCEEDPDGVHGWVFLCDPAADAIQAPRRIEGYGRCRHEAAAFRASDGVCYLSEDRPDSCLYRFVPADPARPFDEGQLFALTVAGAPAAETGEWGAGEAREIGWVPIDDPSPDDDSLRYTAQRAGAAVIRRGEGICTADDGIYLCATSGGPIAAGQILRLRDEGDGGTLEVFAASEDRARMDMPDNVVMDPRGLLWFVEDGAGHDLVRGVRPSGEVFALGRNALSEGEIAGVCFSPDGRAMFVNLQEEGLTLRIDGPFAELVS